jgi:lysophospholipase L1-like esterase
MVSWRMAVGAVLALSPSLVAVPAAAPAATGSRPAAVKAPLRLMALGDSITFGTGSPTRSSYRIMLQGALKRAGLNVDFVGSVKTGACCDRDNEGHGGKSIAQLSEKVHGWLAAAAPDIVLVHAGTNNLSRTDPLTHDPEHVAAELSRLIDQIRTARPTAHIFVAAIIQSNVAVERARGRAFNALLPGVVAGKGNRVYLVDQSTVGGMDLYDAHHPNHYGYTKMAFNWYNAFRRHIVGAQKWPALSNPYTVRAAVLCRWNDKAKTRACHTYRRTVVRGVARWTLIR